MYCVLGEAESDVQTIKQLVKRIANDEKLPVKVKGFASCGELLKCGARELSLYSELGYTRFIICYDSDRADPATRFKEIVNKIINPSRVKGTFCALVPVQEIEAWLLADIKAVQNVIKGWIPTKEYTNPETVDNPKEFLIKLSRDEKHYPRYQHTMHNPAVAKFVDLSKLLERCPSFSPLYEMVKKNQGNVTIEAK